MLLSLFLTFFKVGLLTFGGGYAMLPMIQQEVLRNGWLKSEQLIDFIAVSESTPGSFAVNIATYVGTTTVGFMGAIAAIVGVVLPSFIVILLTASFYKKFSRNVYVTGVLSGLKPAVVGLISAAALSVAAAVFFPNAVYAAADLWPSFGIFAVALLILFKTRRHPIWVVIISAGIGIMLGCMGLF